MNMDITTAPVVDTVPTKKSTADATEKQINFIFKLLYERGIDAADLPEDPNLMTKAAASQTIDKLLALPKVGKAAAPEPDEGFYIVDGTVYKVQVAVHGSGKKYAKVLVPGEYGAKGTFEYVGRKPFKMLTPDAKLTLEKAKELGHLYGMCCVCGATLTKESSIEAGIGPICGSKL